MNRKQKIIVSITGIFIVLLALVGLTYAFFLTRITGNTKDKSISIETANLELVYGDGNNAIEVTNIEPGWTTDGKDGRPASKTFTVTNNGNSTVEGFNIYLENVINQLSRKSDLVYTITCKNITENAQSTTCDDFQVVTNEVTTNEVTTNEAGETEYVFPSVMSVIAIDTLEPADEENEKPAEVHEYTISLTYKEMYVDQSEDMNKLVQAKVNIYDSKTKFLASEILSDSRLPQNNPYQPSDDYLQSFTGVETEEKGMLYSMDDYGTTFYYRGFTYYNYVKFGKDAKGNDLVWRIVRVNGDGSIRLILNEGIRDEQNILMYNDTNYNNNFSDNAYIGYMYGLTGATENVCIKTENDVKTIDKTSLDESSCISAGGEWMSGYDATHDNIYSSNVKQKVDDFYVKYLKKYSDYLSDTMFCGDKSLANKNIKSNNTATGYGQNVTYYAAVERLSYNSSGEEITVATPTFKCASNADNDYSRYTVNVQNLNNVTTNGDLTYPIGLLSADEIVFAGGWNGAVTVNDKYYLSMEEGFVKDISALGPIGWWTMTPKYGRVLSDNSAFSGHVYGSVNVKDTSVSLNTYTLTHANMIRPVINLKSDVTVISGDGSAATPYIIG